MVQKKRSYKKKSYKRRYYKRRYYKRRYYKRRYPKPIKKPEIHITENQLGQNAFNNSTYGMGLFNNLTVISGSSQNDKDAIEYKLNNKVIDGSKVRLKYLYIKGYIKVFGTNEDDFNCKLMVFRWKRNTTNTFINWSDLINNINNFNLTDPLTWTEQQRLEMLYMQDWKNDIKVNFSKRIKNLYRKYDDANNIIPFKIRIPLYDCVLTCDCVKNTSTGIYDVISNPSNNGIYFTFLSNQFNETNVNKLIT